MLSNNINIDNSLPLFNKKMSWHYSSNRLICRCFSWHPAEGAKKASPSITKPRSPEKKYTRAPLYTKLLEFIGCVNLASMRKKLTIFVEMCTATIKCHIFRRIAHYERMNVIVTTRVTKWVRLHLQFGSKTNLNWNNFLDFSSIFYNIRL